MIDYAGKRALVPWLAHISLFSGCVSFLAGMSAITWMNTSGMAGSMPMMTPLALVAPCLVAVVAGLVATHTERFARGEAVLGILFGVLVLLMMNCYLMQDFRLGGKAGRIGA